MTAIKLLVLDIDETIAGHSNEISTPVRKAIEKVQGQNISVTLATGRMYRSALRFHQTIASDLPLIAYNGAWMQNPITQTIHQHLPVTSQIARELIDYFESPALHPDFDVHLYLDDHLYVRELTPATKAYAKRCQVEAIAMGDLRQILHKPPTKVLAMARRPEKIPQLAVDLRARYSIEELHLTQSAHDLFEAIHPQVNKGQAVKYLAETILGIEREAVMAIGDNFNDLEMLQYAGIGIAMGSAPEAVKQVADWVAPDVASDGVAAAIAEFFAIS